MSSCTTNSKKVKKWLDKRETNITIDTQYIKVPVEKIVKIKLPADTVKVVIDCDLQDTIKLENNGIEVEITRANNDSIRIVTRIKERLVIKNIRDTIRTPVAVHYNADIIRYELQKDSLNSIILSLKLQNQNGKLERKQNNPFSQIKTALGWLGWILLIVGAFLAMRFLRGLYYSIFPKS